MKKSLLCLFVLAAAAAVGGFELLLGVSLEPNGTLNIGRAKMTVSLADSTWHWYTNKDLTGLRTESDNDAVRISGQLPPDAGKGTVTQSLKRIGEHRWRIRSRIAFPAPMGCNTICVGIQLPLPMETLRVDGKEVMIPESLKNMVLLPSVPANSVTAGLPGGLRFELSGKLQVYVQDDRRWNPNAAIRIYFTPSEGSVSEATVEFDLSIQEIAATPVALAEAANFAVLSDGATPIGLKDGRLDLAGFPFAVQVAGKGAILTGDTAPASAKLTLGEVPAGAINLLHASTHEPDSGEVLGFIDVTGADGKTESIPVRAGIDCGRLRQGTHGPNAATAFRTANVVGEEARFYASSFPLTVKNPVSATFCNRKPEAGWMIAGVTLSDRPVRFPPTLEIPLTVKPDAKWRPIRFERKIAAGSPLDFSAALDAPAGKYGFLRSASDGGFTFENAPEKRIRFLGVNLCKSANFPTHEVADQLVEYLARMGYNAVRFHHHDNGLVDPAAADSTTLHPEQLDRLDYLFAKLKERGIYSTTDLYSSRTLKAGDSLPDCDFFHNAMVLKALLAINPAALENWKTFARNLMEHKNPYTGLKWGEDPALICLNLVNEETVSNNWARIPETAVIYRRLFQERRKAHGGGEAGFPGFLLELQAGVLDEQIRFVKEELKLKTMVTSLNYIFAMPLTPLRDKFDLVDNHQYFAHPSFPEKDWSLPYRYDQGSAIQRNAILPRLMMPTRIFGKPFIVTEFNFCNPNMFRAEGGPLAGAYAALQDWNGLWRFAWSHDAAALETPRTNGSFDAASDPMQQLSDRIIHALFVRGDFAPAERKISMAVPADPFATQAMSEDFPESFSELGLRVRIGSHAEGKPLPAGVELYRPGMTAEPDPRLKLDRNAGTFSVATPFTETVTLPKGALAADRLRVRNADGFMTVAAIALDRRELPESASVLLIHLTNFTTDGISFGNEEKTLLKNWGKLPFLIERGTAEVELAAAAPWKVTALAFDGTPLGEVNGEFGKGAFRFSIDNCAFPGGVAAYHLTR